MSEQLIPLSDEDRQVLTRKRKAALIWGLGLGTAVLLFLSALILFHTLLWLIIILTASFPLAVSALIGLYALRSLSKDLRGGQKRMISGPVEAQNIDVTRTTDSDGQESDATYRFWIQVGGKKITVAEDQYYQFKKGDLVEAFIAPNSDTVLGINKEFMRRPFA